MIIQSNKISTDTKSYSMNKLIGETTNNDILKCAYCGKTFDEPRVLPCGESICNECCQILMQSTDKTNKTYKCLICNELHAAGELPINKSLKRLLEKSSSSIRRIELVEMFKSNLREIEARKSELENNLHNSIDILKKHCMTIKRDIDGATEMLIHDIKLHREEMLDQVDDYEAKTVATIQNQNKTKEKFEKTIESLEDFSGIWRDNLKNVLIDEEDIAKLNDLASNLKKQAELKITQLNSFIFDNRKITFIQNQKRPEIGMIKFGENQSKMDSLILSYEQEIHLLYLIGLESKSFSLLWRGSRDGFGSEQFHLLCDNKPNTLTIVKSSRNYIFGGFTSVPWSSVRESVRDPSAFLFTLVNPTSTPLKLMNKGGSSAVYHSAVYGPTFGSGHDLHLSDNSNSNLNSFCNSGYAYVAPNNHCGFNGGKFIYGEANEQSHFQTLEVEVFQVDSNE